MRCDLTVTRKGPVRRTGPQLSLIRLVVGLEEHLRRIPARVGAGRRAGGLGRSEGQGVVDHPTTARARARQQGLVVHARQGLQGQQTDCRAVGNEQPDLAVLGGGVVGPLHVGSRADTGGQGAGGVGHLQVGDGLGASDDGVGRQRDGLAVQGHGGDAVAEVELLIRAGVQRERHLGDHGNLAGNGVAGGVGHSDGLVADAVVGHLLKLELQAGVGGVVLLLDAVIDLIQGGALSDLQAQGRYEVCHNNFLLDNVLPGGAGDFC